MYNICIYKWRTHKFEGDFLYCLKRYILFFFRCFDDRWLAYRIRQVEEHHIVNYTIVDQYVMSFYFAVATMTTTGFGDIHAYVTEGERCCKVTPCLLTHAIIYY